MAGKLDLVTVWYHISASVTRKSAFLLQMYQSFQSSGVPASGLRSWGYECQITPRWHVVLKTHQKTTVQQNQIQNAGTDNHHITAIAYMAYANWYLKSQTFNAWGSPGFPGCNSLSVPTFCPCKISHIIFQTRKINISNRRLHARTPICYTKEISSEGEW